MKIYRRGNHWDVTIVETDDQYPGGEEDRLVAMARTPEDAERIVRALNDLERAS